MEMIKKETLERQRITCVGDKVRIVERRRNTDDITSPFRREIEGTIIYIHPLYLVVDNGRYCEAFNKIDFQIGTSEITRK